MKRIVRSITAFILVLTMAIGGAASVTAAALEKEDASSIEVPISERYRVIENGYLGEYDLQEGIFGHQSAKQVNKTAVYFYSDGYFAESPEHYNANLSTMSLTLALSCFNAMRTDFDMTMPQGSYSNLFRHIKVLMSDIGVADKDIFVNESFDVRPTENTIGMIMGAKEIAIDGESYILMPIAVRGGDYESEWASNVTLGASGEAQGFSSAATRVVEQIENYISANTSFDISSALSEGRVKFWVVGYSRGGAVANITAKRLTDTYGKDGNAIYGYTFEAPNGGTDGCALVEKWTYNGVYANIHNIINPNDLVTLIPPKQMGFKRYGVDHYNPGTEAGEITASVYETPTGVTVTTYADNVPYAVGDEDYVARRVEMLRNLAAIDENIAFSDEFSLVCMDVKNVLKNKSLFVPLKEGGSVTADEWLEAFISDLQLWAANGTYSQGKQEGEDYGEDYRDFFTSSVEFAGEECVSLENALQCILSLAFSRYYDEEFADALTYRVLSLLIEYRTFLDLLLNATQKWDDLTQGKQRKYLDIIWNSLDGDMARADGTPVKKISDFVAADERELLKDSVYTLSAFLFLFSARDADMSPSFEGVYKTQVHIATLLCNGTILLQGHYPEICFAWLRSYDENYSSDNESSVYAGLGVDLFDDVDNEAPETEALIDTDGEKAVVMLSSIIRTGEGVDENSQNNGSAIYYLVYENGKRIGDWQLYRAPVVIDVSNDIEYTVKAFAVRFEEKGAEIVIENDRLRAVEKTDSETDGQNQSVDLKRKTTVIIAISCAAVALGAGFISFTVKKRKKMRK